MTLVLLRRLGVTIGTISAIYQDTLTDYVMRSIAILGLSVPFSGQPCFSFCWLPLA